jgi:hypothetical protein
MWGAATTPRCSTRPRHAESDSHPLIRSLQPGEEWSWCFVDELGMVIEEIRGHTRIPRSPLGG